MSFKERIASKVPCLTSLPPSALYLAAVEVFVNYSVIIGREVLHESLFAYTNIENVIPKSLINMSMGFVYAMILSFVLDINWAAVVFGLLTIFAALLIGWKKNDTPPTECLTGAFALSWMLSAVQPLRLAFMAEQIPKTTKLSYLRLYFSFINACGLLSDSGYWIYVFGKGEEISISTASITLLIIFLLNCALHVFIEFSTRYKRKYLKAPLYIDRVCHERGQKQWDMYHIAMTLSAHTFARLMTETARKDQYRAISYKYNLDLQLVSLFGAFPSLVGFAAIILALGVVEPILKRFGVEITDFNYIGAGMIFGCVSLGLTAIIQDSLDDSLRPPNRNEGLLLIFNTLPSVTSLRSTLFDENQTTWLEVPSRSGTTFYAKDVIGKREYAVSISNTEEDIWDEDFLRLEDGKLSTYVIANRRMAKVEGLDIAYDAYINKGKIYVGCSLEICAGNVYFHRGDNVEAVPLPDQNGLTTHHLEGGSYKITTFVLTEREYIIMENFTIKNSDIVAGFVAEEEGDVNILTQNIRHPNMIKIYLLILQDIFVALRDGLFGIGVLRYLYTETNASCPSRQFTYATFFLIFRGLPWMVFGGIRINIFTLNSYLIRVYLLYYGCCTVLFMHMAYKLESELVKTDGD